MIRTLPVLGLLALNTAACAISEPTSPTETAPPSGGTSSVPPGTTVGAPNVGPAPSIVSPTSGSEITEDRPTLVITNVSLSGGTPTYSMEVATDASFTTMVDGASGIPQGTDGRTSWRVGASLSQRQYFWRARASNATQSGPYSLVASFTVRAPGSTPGPTPGSDPSPGPAGLIVSESLATGSLGQVGGGQFTGFGWQVRSTADFIRYEVPTIENGYVEWENTGLMPRNVTIDSYMLFGMWDTSRGAYRENPFRVHLQKLDANHNRPYIRLRWLSEGEQEDAGANFLDWDPSRTYRWRIEWGPQGGTNVTRVFLDGEAIVTQPYGPAYRPSVHTIELGIEERRESVIGAVYSNVRIGRR